MREVTVGLVIGRGPLVLCVAEFRQRRLDIPLELSGVDAVGDADLPPAGLVDERDVQRRKPVALGDVDGRDVAARIVQVLVGVGLPVGVGLGRVYAGLV